MSGRMSLVVFLLLIVNFSNASLQELETRMNRKFQNMNERIEKLEQIVTSQKLEISELNGELANIKMVNSDGQEQISSSKEIELKSFRDQLNRKVDPEVHDNRVHLIKSK